MYMQKYVPKAAVTAHAFRSSGLEILMCPAVWFDKP